MMSRTNASAPGRMCSHSWLVRTCISVIYVLVPGTTNHAVLGEHRPNWHFLATPNSCALPLLHSPDGRIKR